MKRAPAIGRPATQLVYGTAMAIGVPAAFAALAALAMTLANHSSLAGFVLEVYLLKARLRAWKSLGHRGPSARPLRRQVSSL